MLRALCDKDFVVFEDGTYDAVVIDAEEAGSDARAIRLELTIVSGTHRGEVVAVVAHGSRDRGAGSALDLLGLPVTLVVADGQPDVRLDS